MPNSVRTLLLVSAILAATVLQASAAPLATVDPASGPVTAIGIVLLLLAGIGSVALVWWPRN